jgi:hypothetical protein
LATLGLVHDVIASYPDEEKEASTSSNANNKRRKKRLTLRGERVKAKRRAYIIRIK